MNIEIVKKAIVAVITINLHDQFPTDFEIMQALDLEEPNDLEKITVINYQVFKGSLEITVEYAS